MRSVHLLAVAVASVATLPLVVAQQVQTNAQQSTSASADKTQVTSSSGTSAATAVGGGQANATSNSAGSTSATGPVVNGASVSGNAASAATVQMRPVKAELESKLNSKSAKAGDPVIVRTTEKVTTAEGALIPKGTRLVGHVLSAQAQTKGQPNSQIAILFERAEMKGGATIVIHSIIEGLAPSQRSIYLAEDAESNGGRMGTGPMTSSGGMAGGADTNALGVGNPAGGVLGAGPSTLNRAGSPVGAASGDTMNAADRVALSGADAAIEAAQMGSGTNGTLVVQATGMPGVMLTCGSGTASSGVLMAKGRNVELDFGTRLLLGITAQK